MSIKFLKNAAVNSINAARAVLGIECSDIVKLDPSMSYEI